jgi:excisionase family DNA binding protein
LPGSARDFAASLLPGETRALATSPTESFPSKRLLTVREVAERLGVSKATVYALCEQGTLPHLRVSNAIRVAPAALEAYVAAASLPPRTGR